MIRAYDPAPRRIAVIAVYWPNATGLRAAPPGEIRSRVPTWTLRWGQWPLPAAGEISSLRETLSHLSSRLGD